MIANVLFFVLGAVSAFSYMNEMPRLKQLISNCLKLISNFCTRIDINLK